VEDARTNDDEMKSYFRADPTVLVTRILFNNIWIQRNFIPFNHF